MKQIDTMVSKHLDFLDATNITVDFFDGLLVDFAKKHDAQLLVRGIRTVSDFEYEITLANANKLLAPNVQTVFLPTSPNLAVVSSSAVKEVGKYNGPIHHFVTPEVEKEVRDKFGFEQKPIPNPPASSLQTGFIKYGGVPVCPKCNSLEIKMTDDKPPFPYCRTCGWMPLVTK